MALKHVHRWLYMRSIFFPRPPLRMLASLMHPGGSVASISRTSGSTARQGLGAVQDGGCKVEC